MLSKVHVIMTREQYEKSERSEMGQSYDTLLFSNLLLLDLIFNCSLLPYIQLLCRIYNLNRLI